MWAGFGAAAGSFGDAVVEKLERRGRTGSRSSRRCWCAMWSGCLWGRRIRGGGAGAGGDGDAGADGQCELVVDATGVGAPVVDMLRAAGLGCDISSVTITGGEKETARPGYGGGV